MSINIGTTTNAQAGYFGTQRKIIKTSDGNLFLFAVLSTTNISYKKSIDNGDTWGDWVTIYTSTNLNYLDIHNESNNLYLIFYRGIISFIKLTYTAGSYSIGSTVTVAGNYIPGTITKRTDGNFWVSAYSGTAIGTYYSTNDGVSWNSGGNISPGGTVLGTKIIPKGDNLWVLFHYATYLKYAEYISSWGTPVEIAGATSVYATNNRFSVTKISDTDIWIAATKYNATAANRVIKVWHYTGTWDSGTEISNAGTNEDIEPTISIVGDKPVVVWNENAKAAINYRKWNGVDWDAIVELDNTNVFLPTTCEEDDNWLYTYWLSGSGSPYTIYFDKVNLNPTQTKDLTSDAHIKIIGATADLTSDAEIIVAKDLTSNAHIKAEEIPIDLESDAFIVLDKVDVDLTSDAVLSITAVKDLTSDAHLVIPYFKNISNKITFSKGIRYDIGNKISFVKKVLTNVFNIITFVKAIISDVNNDIRFQKRELYNVRNDIRFCKSWQKAGDFGFQSLGKEYIKVYITDVLQTDVDVNSIRFSKQPNQAQTASFDLGRAYDASKPAQEAVVQIKYGDITKSIPEQLLYKGYIVSISPADNPESITINCQDKFWKDNRTNKYFKVGHKPQDDKELYYEKINTAISTVFSWTLNIGNFIPQVIDCFAVGISDALTNLITEAGNYGWFYDENWVRKLWTAGQGSIVNISRQILGNNLKLYDLIEHRFDEDVTSIVNKFRVQMGQKVKRDSDNRLYISVGGGYLRRALLPAWNSYYERVSWSSGDGYGWDNPKPGYEAEYGEVYKKYRIYPPLGSGASGTDRRPPVISVYSPGWYYVPSEKISEGFSIDYEEGFVTFSDRFFAYAEWGGSTHFRAPAMDLELFKETSYTSTTSSSENPEEIIGNPLMFFTDKMGTYPTTIIDDLNLTDLSIQEGGTYYDASGNQEIVPSWDDTEFARDKANWELSKVCDKKIRGSIELTIDTVCFYHIDLSKRIYIEGITETPLNILSMTYDINSFRVILELENSRYFKRSISLQSHGE